MSLTILRGIVVMMIIVTAPFAQAIGTYSALVSRLIVEAQTFERPTVEHSLYAMTNQLRKSKGLPILAIDGAMQGAALAHAMDMMQHGYMGHNASTGQDFDGRMRALRDGALILPSMGENAARLTHGGAEAPDAAARIFQQWLNSAPHRHALLSRDYTKLATGVVVREGVLYADQIFSGPEVQVNFGRKKNQAPQSLY